ncbi:MAG TPA: HDOD domain-containing protein [Lacipirellula sp.]
MSAVLNSPEASTIEGIVNRAGALYSLPAVAVEVLKLTEQEKVNVAALKDCIERDPALTVKILRVVNSSVFGLPREVSDLNQALALLGIKPLKLLALGFSLPESLFVQAAREQLDWYWKSALVRAVAAREISEQLFRKPGDDAFLAGLLQDLGVLVLLGELGRPYAALLGEAIAARADLSQLEHESLSFDHVQLTAGLLERWNLPQQLVAAIGEPRDRHRWARSKAEHAHLVRVLHLAELFAQLIGQRRLSVLPDILEVGEAYCELDKPQLNELIQGLEPKVRQLAGVLSLSVENADYTQILIQAHQQMSRVAESVAGSLSQGIAAQSATPIESEPDEVHALALARQLRASFQDFFSQPDEARAATREAAALPTASSPSREAYMPLLGESIDRRRRPLAEQDDLAIRLTLAVGRCRSSRQALGVALIGADGLQLLTESQRHHLERLLHTACANLDLDCETIERPGETRRIVVIAGRDRSQSVALARHVVDRVRTLIMQLNRAELLPACHAAAGVAWVSTPAKNFRPMSLLETAERCLAAALTSGGVKSLEVS